MAASAVTVVDVVVAAVVVAAVVVDVVAARAPVPSCSRRVPRRPSIKEVWCPPLLLLRLMLTSCLVCFRLFHAPCDVATWFRTPALFNTSRTVCASGCTRMLRLPRVKVYERHRTCMSTPTNRDTFVLLWPRRSQTIQRVSEVRTVTASIQEAPSTHWQIVGVVSELGRPEHLTRSHQQNASPYVILL